MWAHYETEREEELFTALALEFMDKAFYDKNNKPYFKYPQTVREFCTEEEWEWLAQRMAEAWHIGRNGKPMPEFALRGGKTEEDVHLEYLEKEGKETPLCRAAIAYFEEEKEYLVFSGYCAGMLRQREV